MEEEGFLSPVMKVGWATTATMVLIVVVMVVVLVVMVLVMKVGRATTAIGDDSHC